MALAASLALVFLILARWRPGLLAPLNKIWTALGLLLTKVMNPIVMGVVFFIVVTPIGLLMRLSGKDPLRLRRNFGGLLILTHGSAVAPFIYTPF